jgi:hypothetical protein
MQGNVPADRDLSISEFETIDRKQRGHNSSPPR